MNAKAAFRDAAYPKFSLNIPNQLEIRISAFASGLGIVPTHKGKWPVLTKIIVSCSSTKG
jgi:hypothetical protein